MNMQRLPRFFLGLAVGVLFSVTAAYAINADNTPGNGYLLCVNSKTKAVTYPGVLKCPTGSKALELGSQGPEGPEGPEGSQGTSGSTGPAGSISQSAEFKAMGNLNTVMTESRDVAVPSGTTSRRIILATFTDKTFDQKNGLYRLEVRIGGSWATRASSFVNSEEIDCYFQTLSVFKQVTEGTNSPGQTFAGDGRAKSDFTTNFTLSVLGGFAPTVSPPMVLACLTNTSVLNLNAYIFSSWYQSSTSAFATSLTQTP